jgi:hypothetical protein
MNPSTTSNVASAASNKASSCRLALSDRPRTADGAPFAPAHDKRRKMKRLLVTKMSRTNKLKRTRGRRQEQEREEHEQEVRQETLSFEFQHIPSRFLFLQKGQIHSPAGTLERPCKE